MYQRTIRCERFEADGRGAGGLSPEFDALYATLRAAVDCAGVYSSGAAVAGVLLGLLGTIAG